MQKVNVSGNINAPADEVWKRVANFGELDQFVEAVTNCTTEGTGVGSVRTLTMQDGGEVKEKLESLDNDNRVLTYSMVDSSMPIENYTGTIEVKRIDDEQSEFIWSSEFETDEGAEDEMKEALEGLYTLGVEGLNNSL